MINLVMHPSTQTQLEHFIARPAHAVLLTGPAGIGKTALAEAMAAEILGRSLESYPYYQMVRPDGLSISIEAVRQLQKFLMLKTTGEQPIRRIVVVEHAHTMTTEAQNAFLKLLEEPPADTLLILTANSARSLMPTILSRAQQISINAPAESQLQGLLAASNKDAQAQKQAYSLSAGLPGLLVALLNDDEEHPLLQSVVEAKSLLQKTPFERLAAVDLFSKQRDTSLALVSALERIAQAGLAGAGAKQDLARIKQWHRLRKAALKAREALERSANAKLTLAHLFLHLQ